MRIFSFCKQAFVLAQSAVQKIQKPMAKLKKPLRVIIPYGVLLYKSGLNKFFSNLQQLLTNNYKFIAGSLIVSGVLANTGLDKKIMQLWKSFFKDKKHFHQFLQYAKKIGDHSIIYAWILLSIMVLKEKLQKGEGDVVYDTAFQAVLNYGAGFILQGLGALGLGSGRPIHGNPSEWRPCQKKKSKSAASQELSQVSEEPTEPCRHGVSGHAFVGAFPFLLLAETTESELAKRLLELSSVWTGLSRIDSDSHYPSQVLLGLTLAKMTASHKIAAAPSSSLKLSL